MVQGLRVLAVATRSVEKQSEYGPEDEHGMCFQGQLVFLDPPKLGVEAALEKLRKLGISIKVGDFVQLC